MDVVKSMKIIIADAKSLKEKHFPIEKQTPLFFNKAESLRKQLKELDIDQIHDLMKISFKQSSLIYDYFHNEETFAAINLFNGVVFKQLDLKNYQKEEWDYLDKHLLINSPLYGILRYNDAVNYHRLEMKHKLNEINLYQYWYKELNDYLKNEDILNTNDNFEFFDKEKNVIELLEIIKNTSISDQWLLQIIGDGPEIDNLQNFVKINFLAKKVTFLGVKSPEEIHHILLKSKIFAFTSLKEGLPTVLIEAMFCGNVLVSYDCNYGPSDIITEKNGFLIPLHDQKKFCEKIELLTSNSNLINDLMLSSFEESKAWKKNEILKKWNIIL